MIYYKHISLKDIKSVNITINVMYVDYDIGDIITHYDLVYNTEMKIKLKYTMRSPGKKLYYYLPD